MPIWTIELEFLAGPLAEGQSRMVLERDLEVDELQVVIGRSEDADLTIPDATVSRRHCALQLVPDGTLLTDLGSASGIYVNGTKVDEKLLVPGDKFVVGANSLVRLIRAEVE